MLSLISLSTSPQLAFCDICGFRTTNGPLDMMTVRTFCRRPTMACEDGQDLILGVNKGLAESRGRVGEGAGKEKEGN